MRVAVVGAGALGSVYGGRLAFLGGCDVTLIAKAASGPGVRTRLERADGAAEAPLDWIRPDERTGPVPSDADVVLVCVRYEQLDSVVGAARDSGAPLVFLTPMLPQDHARLSSALPGRVVAAMPSVIAYRRDDGTIRYWQPRSATTWIEARPGGGAEVELSRRLEQAGLRAKLDPDTLARNAATTVSFMPMVIGLDVAGGIERALADDKLTSLALRATEEGRALGRSLGKAEPWASTILSFARPFLLKVGVGIARSRAPETLAYVDRHFVRKLHAQNVAMGARMIELAKSRDAKSEALERLVARLANKA
jgi:ketopantoate reductase